MKLSKEFVSSSKNIKVKFNVFASSLSDFAECFVVMF